jgi:hypothetical protein
LIDILNRLLSSCQRLASHGIEECSSWIERKLQERRDKIEATKVRANEGLEIVEEVGKLSQSRGFFTCPMTEHLMEAKLDAKMKGKRGPPGPPRWVRGVLEGIDEGRMLDRDFWIQTHGD